MKNYTLYITEVDTRPTTQQPHGDRKDMVLCERISILDQHECQLTACGQAMCHVLGTQPQEKTLHCEITRQAVGSSQWRHIHV